jgi:hypothetical protein
MANARTLLEDLDSKPLGRTYEDRLKALKSLQQDTKRIEKGVNDVVEVLSSGVKRFVIYGEPQSGKTEFMIAMTCKLVDLGYKTIFIVMNDNTELEEQNYERFRAADQLNPTPMRDYQIGALSDAELKREATRIIFCRKNSRNLQRLIVLCRHMSDRIVIDDEADYATPNTRINNDDITAINLHLGDLGWLHEGGKGAYIGVTATPGRLDLNNTYANESKKWVFLESYPGYKGRTFFFPQTPKDSANSDYSLVQLPDESDDPWLLIDAVMRFLCRVAILNLIDKTKRTAFSMLVHTAGRVLDHQEDERAISNIFTILTSPGDSRRDRYWEKILATATNQIAGHEVTIVKPEDVFKFIYKHIGQKEILTINSQHDTNNMSKAGDPKALFTFAIGGNIVSRGVTFERLLTFYFSRNVRGRLQQNTYIQRARMFGNRPYASFFELCVPKNLFEEWAQLFQDHELSLRLAMAGSYAHLESRRNQVTDRAAVDARNVEISQREHTVGEIFDLSEALINRLINHQRGSVLHLLRELKSTGLIPPESIHEAFLKYVEETSEGDEEPVLLVMKRDRQSGALGIQDISSYTDGDGGTLLRARGGVIHAILNRSPDYDSHRHFFLPITNINTGKIRFLYKSNLGHRIYANMIRR